jgi:hypothetical protein
VGQIGTEIFTDTEVLLEQFGQPALMIVIDMAEDDHVEVRCWCLAGMLTKVLDECRGQMLAGVGQQAKRYLSLTLVLHQGAVTVADVETENLEAICRDNGL